MEVMDVTIKEECTLCGSQSIKTEIEWPTLEDPNDNTPLAIIRMICTNCDEVIEVREIYENYVLVKKSVPVDDIFDTDQLEEYKRKNQELVNENNMLSDELMVEKQRSTIYRGLLMDIYKIGNRGGGNKNVLN